MTTTKRTPMDILCKNFYAVKEYHPFVAKHFSHNPAEAFLLNRCLRTTMFSVYFVQKFLNTRRCKIENIHQSFYKFLGKVKTHTAFAQENMTYSPEYHFADQEYFYLVGQAENFLEFFNDLVCLYGGGKKGVESAWYLVLKVYLFDKRDKEIK
jgi:hypothetical protein